MDNKGAPDGGVRMSMNSKKMTMAALAVMAGTSAAQAQEACSVYAVQPGDSLSGIARTAYGSISFQRVWDANRNVIGSNPNVINVGMELRLPCADGSLPGAAPLTEASATPEVTPTNAAPVKIRLVTGTDYAPFTDEGMEGGGIYTQLVRAAMDTMEPQYETDITFVNDWGSHLEGLLPAQAFDGAFPWLRPNCEAPETLTENSKFRCDNFLHSDPFYEIITGLTVRAGENLETTTTASDFHGKTVCLPDGYTDAAVAEFGLTEPVVTYFRPVNPDDCFPALVAGDVDAVALEFAQAEDAATRMGVLDQVATNQNLTVVNVLAVFVDKNHPNGEEVIGALNQGLENIRLNGEWFQTVRAGFTAFYAN